MDKVVCDSEGYALAIGDPVRVTPWIVSSSLAGQAFIGTITGFNPYATYCVRVTKPNGEFDLYRSAEVRKLANRTLIDAKIKPRPFRRA